MLLWLVEKPPTTVSFNVVRSIERNHDDAVEDEDEDGGS